MTVEEAIQMATERVKALFEGSDHRLEEVSLRDNGDFGVTISYHSKDAPRLLPLGRESGITELFPTKKAAIGVDASRTYKDVLVSKDGQVKHVIMRHIVVG